MTGAAGGSLLLREPDAERLGVRAAVGLEPELWPKVQVRLGEGIAGHVWAEGRALAVHGRANPEAFALSRERFDIAASLCVPLHHAGVVCGVLNLHHPTRADLFSEDDVVFGEQLGALVARIAVSAESMLALRKRALRADVAADVARILGERAPLELRLAALCRHAASRVGRGVATLWWREETGVRASNDAPSLRLAASSLAGGALGAAARLAPGEGVDGRVAREREPIFLRRDDRLAYAALPLVAGAKLLGVLSVQPGGDAPESGDEEDALREVAAAAASGLDRELRAERAETRATRGEAVHEATLRLLAESDPDRIAESVASSAALILDAEHAIVRALDPERRSFRVRCHSSVHSTMRSPSSIAASRVRRCGAARCSTARNWRRARRTKPRRRICWWHRSHTAVARSGRSRCTTSEHPPDPHFDALDRDLLLRLAAVTARALASALPSEAPGRCGRRALVVLRALRAAHRRRDRARGRVRRRRPAFALVTCRIENWEELPAGLATRIARNTQAAFTAQLRSFDVATRTAPAALCALLPIPGAAASEHVARLARAVAEAVAKDDEDAQRVALGFGYALYAGDGETRADLLARAAEPRIRML